MPVEAPVTTATLLVLMTTGSRLRSRQQRQNTQRTARALLDLQRRGDDHRSLGRQQIQIAQALQAEAALAMHVEVRRKRRIEMMPLAEIGADGFGAEAVHVALFDEPLDHGRFGPRRMRAIVP